MKSVINSDKEEKYTEENTHYRKQKNKEEQSSHQKINQNVIKMKLQTKLKKLFPKTKLGKMIWISGALIEVLGFALLFGSQDTIKILSENSFIASIIIIIIGLFIAINGRRFNK